ncbi:hypothetical protein PNOK_0849900 [Pyrrhoderma noxium]|uniref:Uncharacterized protein n=1 Tax=Pyrrhoderma noxium TaxID=2282107 RepID=A0A286U7T0_9AGAM|nr:hypothetical protein PNOK_0849900 [Pyrrhoderma noxium]
MIYARINTLKSFKNIRVVELRDDKSSTNLYALTFMTPSRMVKSMKSWRCELVPGSVLFPSLVTRPTICLVALQDPTSFSPRD